MFTFMGASASQFGKGGRAEGHVVAEREREKDAGRATPFWLKYRTFAWGLVSPPYIGGEARGCLEAVPSRELPSPFPAVLEQAYLLPLCFRGPDRCGQP